MKPINVLRMRNAARSGPAFANVVLLMGGNGTDGSTTFTDESSVARTLTANGNAQVDTAQSKFGGASLLLDGTGDYVSAADSNDFVFGTGQFTVECWARFANSGVTASSFVCQWGTTIGESAIALFMSSGNLHYRWYNTSSSLLDVSAAWAPAASTWYHIAADRDALGKVRLYVGGAMLASGTHTEDTINSPNALRIGSTQGFSLDHNGWIDEVRIIKGVAAYASDAGYTVPTSPFPRS